jgi:hypothetical protein
LTLFLGLLTAKLRFFPQTTEQPLSLTPSESPRISRKMTQTIGPFSVAIPTNAIH